MPPAAQPNMASRQFVAQKISVQPIPINSLKVILDVGHAQLLNRGAANSCKGVKASGSETGGTLT